MEKPSFGKGIFFASTAYVLWGILPFYWKTLSKVNSFHILSFRILFSLVSVGCILLAMKNTSWLKFFKDKKKGFLMTLAGLAIFFNWGIYIWAVNSGHTIETSLGYYINPLLSIIFGMVIFKEKLKILQIIAFCLAAVGVLILTALSGKFPWVALCLAISFGVYGLLKKTVSFSALESLGIETLVAAPLGILILLIPFEANQSFPTIHGISYILKLPIHILILLLVCGAATSFPLYLFAKGAKMLPLSTLGFIQFLSPTLSFIMGFFVFKENFPPENFIAFGLIWLSVILYIISIKAGKPIQSTLKE